MATVDIDWKMLTNARPKTKADSEFYTKLLRLNQSRSVTRKLEEKERARRKMDPDMIISTNMGLKTVTTRLCEECGEEFCHGGCMLFEYEQSMRQKEEQTGPTESRKPVKRSKKKTSKKSPIQVILSPRRAISITEQNE